MKDTSRVRKSRKDRLRRAGRWAVFKARRECRRNQTCRHFDLGRPASSL